jgi:carbamoyl-phosphate synthase large subunit
MKKILVTGAGALLGQGILRLLQIANFSKKIYTADPDPRSSGHWLGDFALKIPKANEEGYIDKVREIVKTYDIDVILIGTDVELSVLSVCKEEFLNLFNCRIIVSDLEVIKIADDKFLTASFLKDNNFPYPFSVMANDKENLNLIEKKIGFPLFAKPIDGARSKGIKKINTREELIELYHPESNLVVQQFLPETIGEFTSGCMLTNGICRAIVTLKRDLRDGNTYRTYRDKETALYDPYIMEVAEKLNIDGPANFQFRVLDGKPIIFEINCRFSGTTPLRHMYGFNEVEALLKYYLFDEEIKTPKLRNGMVLRTWSDIFIENDDWDKLDSKGILPQPTCDFFNFRMEQ